MREKDFVLLVKNQMVRSATMSDAASATSAVIMAIKYQLFEYNESKIPEIGKFKVTTDDINFTPKKKLKEEMVRAKKMSKLKAKLDTIHSIVEGDIDESFT